MREHLNHQDQVLSDRAVNAATEADVDTRVRAHECARELAATPEQRVFFYGAYLLHAVDLMLEAPTSLTVADTAAELEAIHERHQAAVARRRNGDGP